jgi:carboxypeptidase D
VHSKRVYRAPDWTPSNIESEDSEFALLAQRRLTELDDAGGHRTLTAEEHRVKNLPGLHEGGVDKLSGKADSQLVHYAGLLTADPVANGKFFYWLFEHEDAANKPLMIWLNGGPGCSSMDGLFLELGPLRLSNPSNPVVTKNPHSWHHLANIVFIDQPVGTGLSFTSNKKGYAKNDDMINTHFYEFLTNFLKLHDRYTTKDPATGQLKSRKIFFTGESHAGHYIPNIVTHILKKNKEITQENIYIDIGGAALGNPWMDPKNQYDANEIAYGLGIINSGQKNYLMQKKQQCQKSLNSGKLNNRVCFDLLDEVIDATHVKGMNTKMLMYDARKSISNPASFPPGHEDVERYMNQRDVRKAIHAEASPQRFVECADPPYDALAQQDGKGSTKELAEMLDANVQTLVYSGQYDLICNHIGTETTLKELQWSGQKGWLEAKPGIFVDDNKHIHGYVTQHKNLQKLVILNSGHMVPMDQPEAALIMMREFLAGHPLSFGFQRVPISLQEPMLKCDDTHNDDSSSSSTSGSSTSGNQNNNNAYLEPTTTTGIQKHTSRSLHGVLLIFLVVALGVILALCYRAKGGGSVSNDYGADTSDARQYELVRAAES